MKRAMQAAIFFAVILAATTAFAAADKTEFETRYITDPRFEDAIAATVYMPRDWTLEGGVNWNFTYAAAPATVEFSAKSPMDDARFSLVGPHAALCYSSQSPKSGIEAEHLGRVHLLQMKPEEMVKKMVESDKTISNANIVKVDRLDSSASAREKLRQEAIAQLKNYPGIGMTDFQIEEALTFVTFTKNGIPWEAVIYNSASYLFGKGLYGGQSCAWDIGPVIIFQAHAGKMEDYEKIFASILGGSKIDPVWARSVQLVGVEIMNNEVNDEPPALTVKRVAQAAYSSSENQREMLERRSEMTSTLMQGWTDSLTGIDWQVSGGNADLSGVWALWGTGVGYSGGEGYVFILTLGADGKAVVKNIEGCIIISRPATWEADGRELRLVSTEKSNWETTYEYSLRGDTLTLRLTRTSQSRTRTNEKMVLTRKDFQW